MIGDCEVIGAVAAEVADVHRRAAVVREVESDAIARGFGVELSVRLACPHHLGRVERAEIPPLWWAFWKLPVWIVRAQRVCFGEAVSQPVHHLTSHLGTG
jgi:hypothetical protein